MIKVVLITLAIYGFLTQILNLAGNIISKKHNSKINEKLIEYWIILNDLKINELPYKFVHKTLILLPTKFSKKSIIFYLTFSFNLTNISFLIAILLLHFHINSLLKLILILFIVFVFLILITVTILPCKPVYKKISNLITLFFVILIIRSFFDMLHVFFIIYFFNLVMDTSTILTSIFLLNRISIKVNNPLKIVLYIFTDIVIASTIFYINYIVAYKMLCDKLLSFFYSLTSYIPTLLYMFIFIILIFSKVLTKLSLYTIENVTEPTKEKNAVKLTGLLLTSLSSFILLILIFLYCIGIISSDILDIMRLLL